MPSYKLIYFNIKARAEPARYMFELAGADYEDKRVTQDEWKELKPTTGIGQLPVLEVDGQEIAQSGAIYRYVGSQLGFYPADAWQRALVDVVIATANENEGDFRSIFTEPDEAKKAEKKKKFAEEGFLKNASSLEKLLKKNNGGTGWFVGDKITVADVLVFCMYYDFIPGVVGLDSNDFDFKSLDVLKAFIGRFKSEPKIADWIKRRPQTPI